MKACPTCKRTYSDETLTFCLVDGSILSAPYDPNETQRIPAPTATSPTPVTATAPTEILNTATTSSDSKAHLLSTIQSSHPPPLYSEKRQAPSREEQSRKLWVAIGTVMTLLFVLVAGAIIIFIWMGNESAAGDQSKTNTNMSSTVTPTATPTAKPTTTVGDGGWGPRNDQAGLTGERLTYYPGTSPEQCQADCDGNPQCNAYTLIRAGFYNPNDPPMCYLMSVAKDFTPSPCCISAIKR